MPRNKWCIATYKFTDCALHITRSKKAAFSKKSSHRISETLINYISKVKNVMHAAIQTNILSAWWPTQANKTQNKWKQLYQFEQRNSYRHTLNYASLCMTIPYHYLKSNHFQGNLIVVSEHLPHSYATMTHVLPTQENLPLFRDIPNFKNFVALGNSSEF